MSGVKDTNGALETIRSHSQPWPIFTAATPMLLHDQNEKVAVGLEEQYQELHTSY